MDRPLFGPDFKVLGKAGEGSFSTVYTAHYLPNDSMCAVKKLKKRYRSLDEANRAPEIAALKTLQGHPNIVKLIDVIYDPTEGFLSLVFEHLDTTLLQFLSDYKRGVDETTALVIIYQLLKAICFMHSKHLFHRDLKPENCMVNKETFELKLVDFGSTRLTSSNGPFTGYIATRWYRAPECLLTAGYYGPEVDLWAVGCILVELLTGKPLFPGMHDLDQIQRIHSLLGTPGSDVLAAFKQNPNTQVSFSFPKRNAQNLRSILPGVSLEMLDLIERLLVYNPVDRITAPDALQHPAFEQIRQSEQNWIDSGCVGPMSAFVMMEARQGARQTIPGGMKLIQTTPKPLLHHVEVARQPVKVSQSILESRRIAVERIKKYNWKHVAEGKKETGKKQAQYHPAIHIGRAKIVKQEPQASVSVTAFQKPAVENLQPRLPKLGRLKK